MWPEAFDGSQMPPVLWGALWSLAPTWWWKCHSNIWTKKKKKHSKKLTRGSYFAVWKSSGSAVRPRWHSLKIMNVFLYNCNCWFAISPKFCNLFLFFVIKRNLKKMFVFSVSFRPWLICEPHTARETESLFSMERCIMYSWLSQNWVFTKGRVHCRHELQSVEKTIITG